MFTVIQSGSSPPLTLYFVRISKGETPSPKEIRLKMVEISVPSTLFLPGELLDTYSWLRSCFEEERRNDLSTKEDQSLLLGEVLGSNLMIVNPYTSKNEEERVGTLWEGVRMARKLTQWGSEYAHHMGI